MERVMRAEGGEWIRTDSSRFEWMMRTDEAKIRKTIFGLEDGFEE